MNSRRRSFFSFVGIGVLMALAADRSLAVPTEERYPFDASTPRISACFSEEVSIQLKNAYADF
jgi:hypothetical protein